MSTAGNPWTRWWQQERISSDALWERAAATFAARSDAYLRYRPDDVVLDIGCGRGHLAAALEGRVAEIHGLDVSAANLRAWRQRFRGRQDRPCTALDPERYTDLAGLERRYSVVLCVSVLQFYRDVNEVAALFRAVSGVARPGARVLMADLPTGPLGPRDLAELLWMGAREGLLLHSAAYLLRALRDEYRRLSAQPGLLHFPSPVLRSLDAELGLGASILTERLTLNAGRLHLLWRVPEATAPHP